MHKVWLCDSFFSFNTFETEKDPGLASVIADCLLSAECACVFNMLAFQFLHSLPVITLLFLCFTYNLQVIQLSSESKCSHLYSLIAFVENNRLFTLYWQTNYFHFHFCGRVWKELIWFDCWRFWFVVLCGNWEAVELAMNSLLFQSEIFLWCRALIEIKSCSIFSSSTQPLLHCFRLSLKNQWILTLQACTAHLLIRWRIMISLSNLNYVIPISSSFIQRKNGRVPTGPFERFLMRHPENMRANGPRARSGQTLYLYIYIYIY